ncbi:MAG: prenyltransferase/squalene oxidase repeat-containing protein [Deltaproteobacteria bacterium]
MNPENQPIIPDPAVPKPVTKLQSLTSAKVPGETPPSARASSGSGPGHARMNREIELNIAEPEPHIESQPAPSGRTFSKFWRKIGGGSLTLSLLIHGGLIAIFITIVCSTTVERKDSIIEITHNGQGKESSPQPMNPAQERRRSIMNHVVPPSKVISAGYNLLNLPPVPVESLDIPDPAQALGESSGKGLFGGKGPQNWPGNDGPPGPQSPKLNMPPSMGQRCSPAQRLHNLIESGGSPECEKAVSNTLEYLKSMQKPDGSWGTSNKGAMTGLALLCYLGRCETPASKFYGDNVMKGILYLVELSKKNSEGLFVETMSGNATPYEHGIATYSLGEMYALARLDSKDLPGMREAFENGVKTIIKYQHPDGSWVYGDGSYAPTGREDLSVTGWQYQALKSAKLSGLKIPNLQTAIDRTVKYLLSKQTKDGGFGSQERGSYNQWNLSGVGILGLQTLGHGKNAEIHKGIKFSHEMFVKDPPNWSNVNLYAWYYYAQAFFQNGGPEWKLWNETALPAILANQNKDGSWSPNLRPDQGGVAGGDNIYSTALCTLMLEVYYRYLKVGDKEASSLFER